MNRRLDIELIALARLMKGRKSLPMNRLGRERIPWIGSLLMLVLLTAQLSSSGTSRPPEICDNGIDDDGDDLIDLNDTTDCLCTVLEASSLIPNPSFEQKSCCPKERGQLSCADTWIQASVPTTDYIHSCGFLGWEEFPPPRPFPDGEGIIGFRDGRVSEYGVPGEPEPQWKEYAGACLLSPLRTNSGYRFEFFVGFVDNYRSPPIDITFFGTSDCSNLPFGKGKRDFGCPANGPDWVRLGAVRASSAKGWVRVKIDFRPVQDIAAIAIGPDCPGVNTDHSLYYFFDNLVLADERAFTFRIKGYNHPCSADFGLEVPQDPILDYQWYREGVALAGETDARLRRPPGEGRYQVRLQTATTCFITPAFDYRRPVVRVARELAICSGETYTFGSQALRQAGTYIDTLRSVHGCDSIVTLQLGVVQPTVDSVYARIFDGQVYQLGSQGFRTAGSHTAYLRSTLGCDSLIHLTLDYYRVYVPTAFSPNDDGINDRFALQGEHELMRVRQLRVYDRWGTLLFESGSRADAPMPDWDGRHRGQLAPPGVYLYTAAVIMDDGAEHLLTGSVSLVR